LVAVAIEEVTRAPRLAPLYWRALVGAASGRTGEVAPAAQLVLRDVSIDLDHLAAYNRVCGFRLSDTVPITYPHVLGFGLALDLMTRPDFPMPLPGLVHVANRIEVLRPVRVGDRLSVRVSAQGLRPHDRGRQIDVVTEANVATAANSDGAAVWREYTTYLHRSDRSPHSRGSGGQGVAAAALPPPVAARWNVPAGVGARYSRISGDRNPIHTSRVAARVFGFKQRIAHGMWTLARCLSTLEGRLPDRVNVEATFHRPVPLPSTLAFAATRAGPAWMLALADAKTGRSHLSGTIR
jgi:acyl dehydratase